MDTHFLVRSKGLRHLARRFWTISRFYGLRPVRMNRELDRFVSVLDAHGGRATLPIPAVTLARQPAIGRHLQDRGIELAVHGWAHVPLDNRPADEQRIHLRRALDIFSRVGIRAVGFRSPYLRRDESLHAELQAAGFAYVSNQPILWDVLDGETFAPDRLAAVERAMALYRPWHAADRPSLPLLNHHFVELPVSLPDDEMLGDRLGASEEVVARVWLRILAESHRRGELFTINLHPERLANCAEGLSAVLAEARTLRPSVWLARMDEIAAWWLARACATVQVTQPNHGEYRFAIDGPDGTTVLARNVQVDAPSVPRVDNYHQVTATTFTVRAPFRPCLGLSSATSPQLASCLRQQGYIVEVSEDSRSYSLYFDVPEFTPEHERSVLAHIEESDRPLVRLGRWPNGAKSVLTVTGDVDALTLWDYGLRLFGR